MDGGTIISWTPANWITVILMVAIFYAILGFGSKLWKQQQAGG